MDSGSTEGMGSVSGIASQPELPASLPLARRVRNKSQSHT